MSDKAFFDTNVLLYSVSQHDERTARTEALLASGGIISVQVLNEFAAEDLQAGQVIDGQLTIQNPFNLSSV